MQILQIILNLLTLGAVMFGLWFYLNPKLKKAPKITVPTDNASPRLKQPAPYQLQITNTSKKSRKAILYGNNKFLLSPNFGNSKYIQITPTNSMVNYLMMLQQSAQQPFTVSLMRVRSSNSEQVQQPFAITEVDASGQLVSIPLLIDTYFSANQFQSGIIDVVYEFNINGGTYLEFTMLPKTSVTITLFPCTKINLSALLNKATEIIQRYIKPSAAIAATPVYVKPTQSSFGDVNTSAPQLPLLKKCINWVIAQYKSIASEFKKWATDTAVFIKEFFDKKASQPAVVSDEPCTHEPVPSYTKEQFFDKQRAPEAPETQSTTPSDISPETNSTPESSEPPAPPEAPNEPTNNE